MVGLRARLDWRRPAVREDARAQMRFLLEHTRPDADLDAVARAYVRYQARRGELRWHPELLTSLRVEGIEHLLGARDRGPRRGAQLRPPRLLRRRVPLDREARGRAHMVVHPYMLEPDAPLWLQQHLRVGTAHGGTAVQLTAIGTDGLTDLLRRGEIVAIASDVPGRTLLRFAGREARLVRRGPARRRHRAAVVVMTSEEDADGPVIRLHEPLDPADADSPQDLLQRMLTIHEAVILRWPEATDLPLSRWGTLDGRVDGETVARA